MSASDGVSQAPDPALEATRRQLAELDADIAQELARVRESLAEMRTREDDARRRLARATEILGAAPGPAGEVEI